MKDSRRASTRSSRQGLAPTPTGSNITGRFRPAVSRPQRRQARNFSPSGVPVFSTAASDAAAMASISSGAWAMTGLAPAARARLAQSPAETMLETQ